MARSSKNLGAPVSNRAPSGTRTDTALIEVNRRFYDALWTDARLIEAERFNTWPRVRSLVAAAPRRLEVAPGLRLHLPIDVTHFLHLTGPPLMHLRSRGATVARGCITALPFADGAFDLVSALDIIEHVDDDDLALAELTRVAAPGGVLVLSTPLHPSRWTAFDEFVGHRRRYEPERLRAKLAARGLIVEQSAVYGMQPRSPVPLALGIWFLTRRRAQAVWWYNVIVPFAVRFQKRLALRAGMINAENVDEVLL